MFLRSMDPVKLALYSDPATVGAPAALSYTEARNQLEGQQLGLRLVFKVQLPLMH